MNETKNPVSLLTDALANMTLVAMEAERERDAAQKRGDEWYEHYQTKAAQLKETEVLLAKEIQAHKKTKLQLEEATHAVKQLSDEIERTIKTQPKEEAPNA